MFAFHFSLFTFIVSFVVIVPRQHQVTSRFPRSASRFLSVSFMVIFLLTNAARRIVSNPEIPRRQGA